MAQSAFGVLGCTAIAVRRPAWRLAGWLLVAGGVALAMLAALDVAANAMGLMFALSLAALFLGAGVLTRIRRSGNFRGAPGDLRLESSHLVVTRVDGSTLLQIERSDIVSGWLEHGRQQFGVVLELADGRLLSAGLHETLRGRASELLAAVGADARAARMRLVQPHQLRNTILGGIVLVFCSAWLTWLLGIMAGVNALLRTGGALGSPVRDMLAFASPAWLASLAVCVAAFLLGAGCLAWLLAPTRITLGSDGVLLQRLTTRFVTYAQLGEVVAEDGSVHLWIDGQHRGIRALSQHDAAAAAQRIERRRWAQLSSKALAETGALRRGDLSFDDWRDKLSRVLEQGTRYRERVLSADDLLVVAEDPSAIAEERVAAAFAVAQEADETCIERLRIAAAGTVREPLRIALEMAANGELEDEVVAEAAV